jgi:hypothetical protein
MTLVVTHTEGFLGCFTMNPDGSMKQRALIDTGDEHVSPQELAETGLVLAETYGWSFAPVVNGVKKAAALKESDPIKALKAAEKKNGQKKPQQRRQYRQDYPKGPEKVSMILACLAEHPGSTLKEVLELMGQPTDGHTCGNWYHTFKSLREEGRIVSAGDGRQRDPFRFSLAPSTA